MDVRRAIDFAAKAHEGQMYGLMPYTYHLDSVVALLRREREFTQVVGYLHDVLEDTTTEYEDLGYNFGWDVADAVNFLTDPARGSRREKKEAMNARFSMVSVNPPSILSEALKVKAADRLANTLYSQALGSRYFDGYTSEYPSFRKAVYRPELCDYLWNELDRIYSDTKGVG